MMDMSCFSQTGAGYQAPWCKDGTDIPIDLRTHETVCNHAFKSNLCTCVEYEGWVLMIVIEALHHVFLFFCVLGAL